VALIIEVLSRSGRSRQHFKIDADSVLIGRGYQNDVVLNDPHISITHLRLDRVDQGWQITDLESLNGVQVVKKIGPDAAILESGSEIKLGRTKLRIVSDQCPMEETKLLHRLEQGSNRLNQLPVFLLLFVIFTGLELYSSYINSFVRWEWRNILPLILTLQLSIFFAAGLWATIGRFVRHEAFFLAHFNLILIAIMAMSIGEAVFSILDYNTGLVLFGEGARRLLVLLFFTALISANLALATSMTSRTRWLTSVGFLGIILLVVAANEMKRWGDFSPRPEYAGKLVVPTFLLVSGQSNQVFLEQTEILFERADKAVQESANK